MADKPSDNPGTPDIKPGDKPSDVSIDLLVNDAGVCCLVTDRKPAADVECVAYHPASRRMALFFKGGGKFPMEHKILEEIHQRLEKVENVSLIVLTDGQPSWHTTVPLKKM
ncbi:MAG: hypothetical protein M3O22_08825 [Pseudomonadota bacterium]|nr:hypothetical protein [Pseudomonadota bacterium]